MNRAIRKSLRVSIFAVLIAILVLAVWNQANAAGGSPVLPDPVVDSPLAAKKGKQTAVVAGGCFTGETGHAESVKITFDPAQISYGRLLQLFFSVAHDPTQLNRQGPDTGSQYRSVIFYADDEQKHIAQAYISQLEQTKSFPRPIVTQVVPLKAFYDAEAYHQDYARFHPDDPYIARNDAPKVEHLREQFPDLYKK
jgi:peptide-methionine (S)-S-oxide reductase